jgi:hypothetical protein
VTLSEVKDFANIASSVATAGVAVAALCWFLFTRSFTQRIEFDADLRIFDLGPGQDYGAELILTLDNRGQREHRLYNLWCEVRQTHLVTGDLETKSYLEAKNIVPQKLKYFFIPAGVKQTFQVPFSIDRKEKLVRVTALFTYKKKRIDKRIGIDIQHLDRPTLEKLDQKGYTPHFVSKLFEVKSSLLQTQAEKSANE